MEEEVHVAHDEDEHVERLCLERDACASDVSAVYARTQDIPRHDLVVCILCTRMKIEARWAKSPVRT